MGLRATGAGSEMLETFAQWLPGREPLIIISAPLPLHKNVSLQMNYQLKH